MPTRRPAPPPRAAKPPAAVPGRSAEVNRFLAAYLMGVANRLAAGASSHYRRRHGLGMSEWRTLMGIGSTGQRIVREVAEMADLDVALVSKSLKALLARGLVSVTATQSRGRAARVALTPEGEALVKQLRAEALRRNRRLLAAFTPDEARQLWALLERVESQVEYMNAEP